MSPTTDGGMSAGEIAHLLDADEREYRINDLEWRNDKGRKILRIDKNVGFLVEAESARNRSRAEALKQLVENPFVQKTVVAFVSGFIIWALGSGVNVLRGFTKLDTDRPRVDIETIDLDSATGNVANASGTLQP